MSNKNNIISTKYTINYQDNTYYEGDSHENIIEGYGKLFDVYKEFIYKG